ncbi:hypothetical protein EVAR_13906_1 [Eumeta japonica]|uniref:Uncharacterized protein n=1 Tax=Eumeta variegata TaxID=151549 RepID=A0A4C1U9Q9_EUMVA|nr:hypothetical protein EVAR_13906_1 [Eumeta japonica]
MVRKFSVPAYMTCRGVGAERFEPNTAISSSFAIIVASDFASSVIIHISVVTTTIQTPQTSQARNQAQVYSERMVLTDVEEHTSDTGELLIKLEVNFKWRRSYITSNVIREELLVHPVGRVKYYDSPYDAFTYMFDKEIIKHFGRVLKERNDFELVHFRKRMSYDRYILLTKCLHFSDNEKQRLPPKEVKIKNLLAGSKEPFANRYLYKELPTIMTTKRVLTTVTMKMLSTTSTTTMTRELRLEGEGSKLGGKDMNKA